MFDPERGIVPDRAAFAGNACSSGISARARTAGPTALVVFRYATTLDSYERLRRTVLPSEQSPVTNPKGDSSSSSDSREHCVQLESGSSTSETTTASGACSGDYHRAVTR